MIWLSPCKTVVTSLAQCWHLSHIHLNVHEACIHTSNKVTSTFLLTVFTRYNLVRLHKYEQCCFLFSSIWWENSLPTSHNTNNIDSGCWLTNSSNPCLPGFPKQNRKQYGVWTIWTMTKWVQLSFWQKNIATSKSENDER